MALDPDRVERLLFLGLPLPDRRALYVVKALARFAGARELRNANAASRQWCQAWTNYVLIKSLQITLVQLEPDPLLPVPSTPQLPPTYYELGPLAQRRFWALLNAFLSERRT